MRSSICSVNIAPTAPQNIQETHVMMRETTISTLCLLITNMPLPSVPGGPTLIEDDIYLRANRVVGVAQSPQRLYMLVSFSAPQTMILEVGQRNLTLLLVLGRSHSGLLKMRLWIRYRIGGVQGLCDLMQVRNVVTLVLRGPRITL